MSSSLKRPAPPSSSQGSQKTKNLKQGNLFSFFGKKPSSAKDAAPTAAPVATQSPAASASASTPKQAPASTEAASALWKKVTLGTRVAVYWPDDKSYYNATVTSVPNEGKSMFTLSYEDGEVERVNLAAEQFRILGKQDEKKQSSNKRRIAEESEEEMEFDDVEDESEASAYEEDGNADEDEDLDEDDQWMVTDDEEELLKQKKKGPEKKKQRFQVTEVVGPSQTSKKTLKTPIRPIATKAISPYPTAVTQSQLTVTPPERVTPSPASIASQPRMPVKGALNPAGSHVHNHLKFLQNPKDAQGRTQDHPLYDSHTLKVDYRELEKDQKLTPASRQWWELKARYFDTVLFFKTGKFYELYHMDADIGVQELDFTYMKGHIAHAGFPEVSYGVMAGKLVRAGYKVARVEQTETPEMLKARKKKKKAGTPTPQVVNREVCSILTLGTRTFCYLDDDKQLHQEGDKPTGPLVAIREVMLEANEDPSEQVQPVCEYGVTIVDAPRATITIGQFADDVLRSRMNTLLTAFEPSEILVAGGESGASETLLSLIRSVQAGSRCACRLERIQEKETFPKSTAVDFDDRRKLERKSPIVQPWNVDETLEEIHRRGYYPRASRQQDSLSTTRWPKVLRAVVEGNAKLALSSFGAALFYLQRSLIDVDILGMGLVKAYIPPSSSGTNKTSSVDALTSIVTQQDQLEDGTDAIDETQRVEFESDETIAREQETNHLSLDGTTLQNLEVLMNSQTQTSAGSLWSKLNFTKTPHGCRLLRAWLLRPLFRKADIDRRTDVVEELVSGGAAVALSEARNVLAKCGDMERLLSRVHSMGGGSGDASREERGHHPNERAVLYETATHTKRKVSDFSKILNGLRHATQIPEQFEGIEIKSPLLEKIVHSINDGGCFPDMTKELDWFFDNFDCEQAAQGLFEPSRGIDETYDEACDTIERIYRELEEYKDEMCANEIHPSNVGRSQWKYINTKVDSKDKYLIELPASVRVPDDFVVKGKRGSGAKQVNKYRTAVIEQLVQELERALDIQKEGRALGMKLIFAKFDSMRHLWAAAAQATAMLDALGSLAQAASRPGYSRAQIIDCPPNGSPCIHIVQGRHPCVDFTHNGGQFIPNDLTLGGESELEDSEKTTSTRVLLLSGPNMGGKSTLLRQTSLIIILAQIGCFVPAEECVFTPIDRIYTRLGASDRILLGQSTFFVELAETASALRGATRRSLVLMDELGRGTSTFDGTAIASASVKHLVERNKCLTLFATHYHTLLEEWKDNRAVRLGHMQCLVEGSATDSPTDNPEDDEAPEHSITFLYTLGEGVCPKSFGINVARLAGLPEEVLSNAKRVSSTFEAEMSRAGVGPDPAIESNGASGFREMISHALRAGALEDVERVWNEMQPTSD